jgi:tRNA(Ile)-lysidine synthase
LFEENFAMDLSKAPENLDKNRKYLLAVSGGVDSMVLLYLFSHYKLIFSVVHCNFQLRGRESDQEEELVKSVCQRFNIELFTKRFNTLAVKKNQESTEMTARNLRYDYFQQLLLSHPFDYLVTAHHLNDQVETFFINLLRGAGLKGLSGMQPINGQILRPLLSFFRKEILNFAQENSLVWREDSSNQSTDYLRNKLRHKVVPELEKISPSFLRQVEKSMKILRSSCNFITKKTEELQTQILVSQTGSQSIFSLKKLQDTDFVLAYHFLSQYGFSHEQDCKNILSAQTGSIFLSPTHKIWINREQIIIESDSMNSKSSIYKIIETLPFEIQEPVNLKIRLSEKYQKNKNHEFIDFERVKFPLLLRDWQNGDFFFPINGNGKKKISKFLKDEKVANADKNKVLVLCDNSNAVVWLVGFRLDDRFKISEKTQKFICLTLNAS